MLKINTQSRWTNDPPNEVKVGLGLVKYIECGNELDKWWKAPNGYMNAYEYATLLSAFYDGHKGMLGNDVEVKTADSTMQGSNGRIGAQRSFLCERHDRMVQATQGLQNQWQH